MRKQLIKNAAFVLSAIVLLATVSCTNNTTTPTDKKNVAETQKPDTGTKQSSATPLPNQPVATDKEMSGAWLLVPGQSAGLTRINQNAEEVYKRLGPPDGGDAAMQKTVAIWYTNHDSTNHSVAIYTARDPGVDPVARIQQIRITSPEFKTAKGIGPGSTITDIRNVFTVSQTENYNNAHINYRVYDSPQGIAFEINPNGRCVAVVIHEADVTGKGTYLKFRTTNKFINKKRK